MKTADIIAIIKAGGTVTLSKDGSVTVTRNAPAKKPSVTRNAPAAESDETVTRNAARQKKHRERQKALKPTVSAPAEVAAVTPSVTRNASAPDAKSNAAPAVTRNAPAKKTPPSPSPPSPLHPPSPTPTPPAPLREPTREKADGRATKRQQIEDDIREADHEPLPIDLRSQEFRDAWDEWCLHRAELYRRVPAKRWTQQAAKNTLLECARHGEEIAIMAIRAAVSNGWQGLVWDRLQVGPSRPAAPNGKPTGSLAVPVRDKWNDPAHEYEAPANADPQL